ncbi:hypothetical protein PR202_ga03977 [Eleusine coracana subsp. coracana]|uniref:Uncharacterized protein n=1 Tax=Eleusine coracana subsp. coracana TaxID=191504 RepID=A0AAV5BP47_ELECO|nr:hypothetical protein PR202_ga03977 [Eleusine coracana subsp. coracana]
MAAPLNTPTAPCGKKPPGFRPGSAGRVRLRASPWTNPITMMNTMNATCTAVSTRFTDELSLDDSDGDEVDLVEPFRQARHGDPPLARRVDADRRAEVRREAARHGGVGEDVLHDQVRARQERSKLPCHFLQPKPLKLFLFFFEMEVLLVVTRTTSGAVVLSQAKVATSNQVPHPACGPKRANRISLDVDVAAIRGRERDKFC